MEATKFQLRLPPDVKRWLEEDAQRNDRSMNGQVVAILRERMNHQAQVGLEQKMD
jgi:predicted HicB family RNase H-like nuclease